MRCLSCKYDLRNLTREGRGAGEHRCPECGRQFDPHDATTFDPGMWHTWPKISHVLLIILASGAIGVLIAFLTRSRIARPPFDPREFADIASVAIVLGMMFSGLLLLPYLLISTVLIIRNRRRNQREW